MHTNYPSSNDIATTPAVHTARGFSANAGIQYKNEYLRVSKSLTYSYLFTLPLFIIYEVGVWLLNGGAPTQVRIGADVIIQQVLGVFGLSGTFWLTVLIVALGGAIFLYDRRKPVVLKVRYFGYMFLESTVYATVIGLLIATVVKALFGIIPALQIAGRGSLAQNIVLSFGAGIYEELVFRLFLVSALYALLSLLKISPKFRYGSAAIVAAVIFSWMHYIGALGYPFTLSSFVFRALMGLALNLLFIFRGFGVAAMTHSLYDVLVTLMQG